METRNLAERYGLPGLDWSSITDRLAVADQVPGSGGPDRHTA